MKRRTFFELMGGATATTTLGIDRLLADFKVSDPLRPGVAGLPRRILGRTGWEVSIIGFPALALMRLDQNEANRAVQDAFHRGVNYFDNAPAYGRDGDCERKLGPALEGIDRSQIFLACKTKARDKAGARAELERSLERHRTDRFDLYQMHHLVTVDEVRQAFAPGGAIEAFLEAREQGKIRWIGFSAHSTRAALAALKAFEFDTVMFPVSFAEFYLRDFGKAVLESAADRGAAVLAIKPMCMGAWPEGVERTRNWWYRTTETPEEVSLALRFALSLKGVVSGFPPAFVELLDKALIAAREYEPATAEVRDGLRDLAQRCESIFIREDLQGENSASLNRLPYPEHAHECMG
ncbi:MAG: aldo/keto reductase [Verrucomicrobiae bacterium]|nr:aldo/keto reductase [Verrucomicrobiae bacterium]